MPRLFSLLIPLFLMFFSPVYGQDTARTILVFDGSGSMWGQIEGKAKITIAQEVIGDLLQTFPDDQALGLTVYGHRRKGDCSDIETMVAPATGTRAAIGKAVNAIKPRGKTPLSAAVIAAAEELKYTEDKATVILISDGKETCDYDPCAVGKALEEAGVDFTAHVIGFDVAKKADRAQLQCLAENTGGRFITASNAAELTEAVKVVSEPAPPKDVKVRFSATDGPNGPTIFNGIVWQLSNEDTGDIVMDMTETDTVLVTLKPGSYRAEVMRAKDESFAQLVVNITENGNQSFVLALPEYKPLATLMIPEILVAGSTVDIGWTGPDEKGDYLSSANEGDRPTKTLSYAYTRDGQPVGLQMPPEPGQYELRYIHSDSGKILASKMVTVVPFEVSINVPETGIAGETLPLEWIGPNYELDYLSTANQGDRGSQTITYTYTKNGQPLGLMMPAEPGEYEVRYVLRQGNTVVFRKTINVVPFEVSIDVPDTATVGQTLMLNWSGPGYHLDYLATANAGDRGSQAITYTYTRDGTPLGLMMPPEPGDYEIRYVLNQKNTVVFRKMIRVTDVVAALNTPDTATAGETLMVDWTGPAYNLDYLSVAEIGSRGSQAINYTYTRDGSPLGLKMPTKPGEYELRYVLNQGNTVIARKMITITEVNANLTAPTSARAGESVIIEWTGPNYNLDYISVAEIGSRGSQTINYAYTRDGNKLRLDMPAKPGSYELRYVLNQGNSVLVSQRVEITPVTAALEAPDSGGTGSRIIVTWSGPNYERDYVSVAEIGSRGSATLSYAYTGNGPSLQVTLPDTPGQYELRYVMRQGNTVLATKTIRVD